MSKNEFQLGITKYMGGPEHNNYYEVMDALNACLSLMTDEQRKEAFNNFVKLKQTNRVKKSTWQPLSYDID